jgi:hypothetical protein
MVTIFLCDSLTCIRLAINTTLPLVYLQVTVYRYFPPPLTDRPCLWVRKCFKIVEHITESRLENSQFEGYSLLGCNAVWFETSNPI